MFTNLFRMAPNTIIMKNTTVTLHKYFPLFVGYRYFPASLLSFNYTQKYTGTAKCIFIQIYFLIFIMTGLKNQYEYQILKMYVPKQILIYALIIRLSGHRFHVADDLFFTSFKISSYHITFTFLLL